ncbi:hypothetical protein [Micromonospora noduli]|nr:hypothetical protein [Micromonospora noduli]
MSAVRRRSTPFDAVRRRWAQFKAVQGTPLLPTCSPTRARAGPPTAARP